MHIKRMAATIVVCAGLAVAGQGTATAWSNGVNRVETAAEDSHAQVGLGPGWVLLSYKANGPMIGYLFADGFKFADGSVKRGSDHMDIRDVGRGGAGHVGDISRWPWGYAGGEVDGCAYAYGTTKFAAVRPGFSSDRCANGPQVKGSSHSDGTIDRLRWWHSEKVFCRESTVDQLCSPYGVWSANKGGAMKEATTAAACPGYGNISAAAAYGTAPAKPKHLLATVPAGETIDVRYETKDRQWVMAKWRGHELAGGTRWAFMPRSCVTARP
ncbi:hypothetical protein [Lentzea terrae]|uniref:hypothetical protein n=1 Tax=Lentzea terrae TaxID=2200761 RepID=UPI0013003EB3|nr:hypothetical protein [Lentzea terrae]